MWPQQMWGQRSSRGQWPSVQVFAKRVTVSTYCDVFSWDFGHNDPSVESTHVTSTDVGSKGHLGVNDLASSFLQKKVTVSTYFDVFFMGLGHNGFWVKSHIRPQQMWGQRSSRGQWPLVQVFAKTVTVSTYFDVCSGETRGSRTTLLTKCWTPFWKTFSVTENNCLMLKVLVLKTIIFQCSKNYG